MYCALESLRGNEFSLDPSAEVSVWHRQNTFSIYVLDMEDVIDFVLCFLEESLTNSTGCNSLEPGLKSAEGGFESLLHGDLEMRIHKGVMVVEMVLILFVN